MTKWERAIVSHNNSAGFQVGFEMYVSNYISCVSSYSGDDLTFDGASWHLATGNKKTVI